MYDAHGRPISKPQVRRGGTHTRWPASAKITVALLILLAGVLAGFLIGGHLEVVRYDANTVGSFAEWVTAIGVPFAIWLGFHEYQLKRKRSDTETGDRTARDDALSKAMRIATTTHCLIDEPNDATPDELGAIATWTEEQRRRGWRVEAGLWHRNGQTPLSTSELLGTTDRRLPVRPWIERITLRNASSDRVIVTDLVAHLRSGHTVDLLAGLAVVAPDEQISVRLTSPSGAALAFAAAEEAGATIVYVTARVLDAAGRSVNVPPDYNIRKV
jgi:hypothetical protein